MGVGKFFIEIGRVLYALAAIDGNVTENEMRQLAYSVETASSRHFRKHGYFAAGMLLSKVAFLKALERKEHPAKILDETRDILEKGYGLPLTEGERSFLEKLMESMAHASGGVKQMEERVIFDFNALIS
ncbi:MAG: hypothetical protein ACKO1U_10195 [Bacteroidota bacterium]